MLLDFLIIGQGIAGTTLAWHLLDKGAKFRIIDQEKKHTSSWAAAGLYNPVTGRQMVKTWQAENLFPYLQNFYRDIENRTGQSFLHPKPIYRPFISQEEQNDWLTKADNKAFAPFVEKVASKSLFPDALHDPWGGILLKQSGYLDVPLYLEASRNFFRQQDLYLSQAVEGIDIQLGQDAVSLYGLRARTLIYCDGPDATQNPYFNWLPFSPVKGEILLIKPEITHDVVFNRGIFVLPTGAYSKVGSTYDHDDLSYQTTEKGKKYLEEKIGKLCKFRYDVVDQIAGVRPATRDRKPFIGLHPTHKPLAIFNGLGTKGVSLAPYFASQFTEHLLEQKPLEEAIDVKRFYHLYNTV
jgi:glycine/D-amino acid oxidase-like deaminating enzyme